MPQFSIFAQFREISRNFAEWNSDWKHHCLKIDINGFAKFAHILSKDNLKIICFHWLCIKSSACSSSWYVFDSGLFNCPLSIEGGVNIDMSVARIGHIFLSIWSNAPIRKEKSAKIWKWPTFRATVKGKLIYRKEGGKHPNNLVYTFLNVYIYLIIISKTQIVFSIMQGVPKTLCSRDISIWRNNLRSIFTIKVS